MDVDIQINSGEFSLAVAPGPNEMSLVGILTHEVGHLLGLDHSDVLDATMRNGAEIIEAAQAVQLESLAPDDVAGVCGVYETAPVRPTEPAEPVPSATPGGGDTGCALHSPGGTDDSSGAFLVALAAVVVRLRRTRRGRLSSTGECVRWTRAP